MSTWQTAQEWESEWWKSHYNMAGEVAKQQTYAGLMGLTKLQSGDGFDLHGMSVLDIGGGPASLLLRCYNFSKATVLDPCDFPKWALERYADADIEFIQCAAEDWKPDQQYDEVWIYNVLQHTRKPDKVVATAKAAGGAIRVFEWVDTKVNIGHLHSFTRDQLDALFGGYGSTLSKEEANSRFPMGAGAACYYGIFNCQVPTVEETKKFRFHLLGLAHLPVSERYMGCAFTQKIVKLSKMLLSLGYEVYLYGAEGSDTPCTEFIQTHTLEDIRRAWGEGDKDFEVGYNWKRNGFKHDLSSAVTSATLKYYSNCIMEINNRKQPDDFLLLMQGVYQKPIADAVNLWLTCEPGIGYRGSYARFRAFESAYMQNFTYGSEHPRESINGNYYDRVIPNYFDPKDFPMSNGKDDFFLFVGRTIIRKGVWTAIKATEALGQKLIIAGQDGGEIDLTQLPPHCEFVGYIEPEQRADLMGRAKAVLVPTTYLEPFGGVNVEAQLCGTPAITTNFGAFPETVKHGVTGFLCDTLQDFVDAANSAGDLNPADIRKYAERYLMDNVRWEFQKWFEDLYQLYLSATYLNVKGWHYLPSEGV